ncbi:MAG: HigA family addiction module antitoxin [Alphaproteobacteria bacterium]
MAKLLDPITPGEILLEEFLKPLDMSQNELAHRIGVGAGRVSEIVHGRRAITAETALRLARLFGTTPEFWLNLQARYALKLARRSLAPRALDSIRPLKAA